MHKIKSLYILQILRISSRNPAVTKEVIYFSANVLIRDKISVPSYNTMHLRYTIAFPGPD